MSLEALNTAELASTAEEIGFPLEAFRGIVTLCRSTQEFHFLGNIMFEILDSLLSYNRASYYREQNQEGLAYSKWLEGIGYLLIADSYAHREDREVILPTGAKTGNYLEYTLPYMTPLSRAYYKFYSNGVPELEGADLTMITQHDWSMGGMHRNYPLIRFPVYGTPIANVLWPHIYIYRTSACMKCLKQM